MALVTHQLQGSCATLNLKPSSWTKEVKLKHRVEILHIGRTDRSFLLKRNCLRVRVSCARISKEKSFKILAFKGSVQNDESGSKTSGSYTKNSVYLSCISQDSQETELESSKAKNVSLPRTSKLRETVQGSTAVHKLFKKWLMMMRTQSPGQVTDNIFEGTPLREVSDAQNVTHKKENTEIQKAVWSNLLALDATIKLPLLIFIPGYLTVNFLYGFQVSKELTPLWVFGPLIVALYIKIFRGIIALYVFSLKKMVKLIMNLPSYYMASYTYIAQGKLKNGLQVCFAKPIMDMTNLDYKDASKRKLKELEEWAAERYLDGVELIWPFYCRTIRFLKRANFI